MPGNPKGPNVVRKPDRQTLFLGSVIICCLAVVAWLVVSNRNGQAGNTRSVQSNISLAEIPFNGQRAYEFLVRICELGPRPCGSEGMAKQRQMLAEHFTSLGGKVELQKFRIRHPVDGSLVPMANLIVRWHPDRERRILLAAHYDTRPYPDRDPDPRRRQGIFIGANDGASGVAVLTELAYHMDEFSSEYGVDFVLFDGEEFVFNDQTDKYFHGSEHFARDYVMQPPQHRYRWGVLLDMVGDAQLQLFQERFSMSWPETQPLVLDIWDTARTLGITEFVHRLGAEVRDDHLPLRNIARIPTCNIIDFDYPRPGRRLSYWHTEADTPDKCSALSLAKVGWVVLEWLKQLR